MRLTTADLASLGINRKGDHGVTVLADHTTGRIAIRWSREGEFSVRPTFNKAGSSAVIPVAAAVAAAGREWEQVKGEYPVMGKDDLLIVQLR